MGKIVYVCSDDAAYRNYVGKTVKLVAPESDVVECESQKALFTKIRNFQELYIVCDTFFLGLRLTEKLHYIKWFLCDNAKIMITAWHAVDLFFGMRVKNLKFDGFLNDIGIEENLKAGLTSFFDKKTYFDKDVENEYMNKSISQYAKCVSDISYDEIELVMSVRKFGNKKYLKNGKHDSAVYNKLSNFKKKIGIDSDVEIDNVIQRFANGGVI